MKFNQQKNTHRGINYCLATGLLIIFQLIAIQVSFAQRVQPMVFELEPIGSKSSATLRIENTQQQALTVEVVATKIKLDEVGNETRTPAYDDFLIYPPQTLIRAGKSQIVRVKYIGDPGIKESQAYRISVKQLPVDMRNVDHTGVGMVINFNTLVNVSPKKAKADVFVSDISPANNGQWELTIENTGNRFARLSTTTWNVSSTADPTKTKHFKSLEVGELAPKNLVMPHSKLRMLIPAIEGFEAGTAKITIVQ